jgi:hypothetical protein
MRRHVSLLFAMEDARISRQQTERRLNAGRQESNAQHPRLASLRDAAMYCLAPNDIDFGNDDTGFVLYPRARVGTGGLNLKPCLQTPHRPSSWCRSSDQDNRQGPAPPSAPRTWQCWTQTEAPYRFVSSEHG